MDILYIEPYYGSSHKSWIEGYNKYSDNNIDILSLPGNKWKWRMHGGAITLSKKFNDLNKKYDLIICSDFLNLPVFKSLSLKAIADTPISVYFHENQASYPWSPNDSDKELNRDFHYYYINQTTSLASDWNFFNSSYHLDSYIEGLKRYIKKMPDYKNEETLNAIKRKSSILHLGCDFQKFGKSENTTEDAKALILWNHRWEYDKNPELFFKALKHIQDIGLDFSLLILGERFNEYPDIFKDAIKLFSDNIITSKYCSFDEYKQWLWRAHILPVTSNQDFFGISVMEAVYCKTYPILPNRLAYRELFNPQKNPEFFYDTEEEFQNLLIKSIKNYNYLSDKSSIAEKFDWKNMVSKYDREFQEILSKV